MMHDRMRLRVRAAEASNAFALRRQGVDDRGQCLLRLRLNTDAEVAERIGHLVGRVYSPYLGHRAATQQLLDFLVDQGTTDVQHKVWGKGGNRIIPLKEQSVYCGIVGRGGIMAEAFGIDEQPRAEDIGRYGVREGGIVPLSDDQERHFGFGQPVAQFVGKREGGRAEALQGRQCGELGRGEDKGRFADGEVDVHHSAAIELRGCQCLSRHTPTPPVLLLVVRFGQREGVRIREQRVGLRQRLSIELANPLRWAVG